MMMENKESLTLIDGQFDPADASTLISTLFGAKIDYHNRNILRASEGCGTQHPQEGARVIELGNSRQAFQQKMKLATEQGCEVEIKSMITVSFIQK